MKHSSPPAELVPIARLGRDAIKLKAPLQRLESIGFGTTRVALTGLSRFAWIDLAVAAASHATCTFGFCSTRGVQ
jgi:hypothetical protein